MDTVLNAMRHAGSATQFAHLLSLGGRHGDAKWEVLRSLRTSEVARRDFNGARNILEMPPIRDWSDLQVEVGPSNNNDTVVVKQPHPSQKPSATRKIKKKEV